MGRGKKPKTVIARVRKRDLDRVKRIAKKTNKTIVEVWSELAKHGKKNIRI